MIRRNAETPIGRAAKHEADDGAHEREARHAAPCPACARDNTGRGARPRALAAVGVMATCVAGLLAVMLRTGRTPALSRKEERGKAPACVRTLVEGGRAVLANATLPAAAFRLLVHPPATDRYITKKILGQGAYEPEMAAFVARALPLREDDGNGDENGAGTAPWAVDVGANVGFHALHMAHRGACVLAFEPAPDTAALLRCSGRELLRAADAAADADGDPAATAAGGGSLEVVEAGAADVAAAAGPRLRRHPASPGMTTFGAANASEFPLEELAGDEDGGGAPAAPIALVRVADALAARGAPEGRHAGRDAPLRLLKVDAEGYELRALRGANLTRYPFRYLAFELFPAMLRACGDDPVDLLVLVREAGYRCDYERRLATGGGAADALKAWVASIGSHVNVYCEHAD